MTSRPPKLLDLWRRVPLPIRAPINGLLVFLVLQAGASSLLVLNVHALPHVPWSVPISLFYLWIVFRWLGGRWAPSSTADARRNGLRARGIGAAGWRDVSQVVALLVVFILAVAMLNYRIIAVPEDPDVLPSLPWWTLLPMLIMVSIVAGVSEESGFRGYMQGPLESRYGPGLAITVTAVLFWVAHLNHPSGPARFPSLLTIGITLGALTYVVRSIVPAIVAHAVADTIAFVGSAFEIGPRWLWHPPMLRDSGVDGGLVGTAAVAVITGVGLTIALRRLAAPIRAGAIAGSGGAI